MNYCGVESNDSTTSLLPNIYFLFEQNDFTPPKCGELSDYTDSAYTEVGGPSSRCMNGSKVYDRCGHNTRQFHPYSTACRRSTNLPGPACSRPDHSNHLAKWKEYRPTG